MNSKDMNINERKTKQVVMILTNGFDPDVRVYKEAKYLVSKGFGVTILCWDRDLSRQNPEIENVEGINVIRFKIESVYGTGAKQIKAFFKYIKACKEYLKNNSCYYIHCNDLDGAITGYLAGKSKANMVFDMHEFYEKGNSVKRKIIRAIVIFLIKRSKAALYENNIYLEKEYKSVHDKLFPLRNYPDSGFIQALPKTKSDKFRIAYHGVVRDQIPEFTALFEAVKGMQDVMVDINGGGIDLKQLQEIAKQYTNVSVNGPYDGINESSRLYSKTDLLFCAYNPFDSNYQGDAEVVKYYEAVSTGTPILVTDTIGLATKVKKYNFGITCNTRNADEIRNAINMIKNNIDLWNTIHESELNQAYMYSWNKAVKILDNIYT